MENRNEKGQFVEGREARNKANLVGKEYGRLTVLEEAGRDNHQNILWSCKCRCGNETKVRSTDLKQGKVKSCGCLRKEKVRDATVKHGIFTDGNVEKPRLYRIWLSMKDRCRNPNNHAYKNYGKRGISICEEWEEYQNFKEWAMGNGYQDDLTIHRIDNEGNYCPSNCKWATRQEQANNMRTNHLITYQGETKTMAEWAREFEINYATLADRLNHQGLSPEEALTTPLRR